jgi:hypothetical protein
VEQDGDINTLDRVGTQGLGEIYTLIWTDGSLNEGIHNIKRVIAPSNDSWG